jgi:hypothetical protein
VRRITLIVIATGLLTAALVSAPRARAQLLFGPSKMPDKWDSRIPLPPKSTLLTSSGPHEGDNYSAEFLGPRSYHDTVKFFEIELPKAGFTMGPVTASPKRKLYQRIFTDGTVKDKLTIHTRPGDNLGLITIQIEYTLPPRANPGAQ